MTSKKGINVLKFERYCQVTAELYVSLYAWYYMPVTVHKILLQDAKVIESIPPSIGQLTEVAQEASSKDFKRIREFNTRKSIRIATIENLRNKWLVSTDPLINI